MPFDPAALGGDSRLQTASTEALALAESLRKGPAPRRKEDGPLPPNQEESSIDWQELAAFLRDPLKFFFRDTLGIHSGITLEEEGEEDVLEAGELEWWQWRNRIISEDPGLLADPESLVRRFSESLRLSGAVAATPFSALSGTRQLEDARSLADQLKRLQSEGLATGRPFSVLLDPAAAVPSGSPGPGELLRIPSPRIPLEDGRVLALTGRLPGLRLLEKDGRPVEGIWTGLDFISGNRVKSRHLLLSWTAALILGSMDSGPMEYRVFRLGGHDFPARHYHFDAGTGDGTGGAERRVLARSSDILEALVRIRERSRRTPLILHHEVADELSKAEKKNGALEGEILTDAVRVGWNAIVGNTRGFSSLRDNPYRSFLPGEPDYNSPLLQDAWRELYRDGGLA